MKVRKRSTCWLAFILLCCCSAVMGQELPYEVTASFKPSMSEANTTSGLELLNYDDNTSSNTFKISNYLIASKTGQAHSDSLSGEGIPIGFNFPYVGETFDVFGISAKGYIVLGKKEEGIKLYADTLRYEAGDTIFTKRNKYLISGLLLGKNANKAFSVNIAYKNYGFPGKHSIAIHFRTDVTALGPSNYYLYVINNSSIILYEDGKIDVAYYCEYLATENADFETAGFFVQRYGTGKELTVYAENVNGFDWAKPTYAYGISNKFGRINDNNYPTYTSSGIPTLAFIPTHLPLALVQPFTWDMQGRQGKLSGYFGNDHSLLENDTVSTTTSLWWYAPQYEPLRYDAYLGTDTLSMVQAGLGITGDSVNPRNGFQKVPLARLELDSLAPSTHYYLKIISRSATDSLISYTSFYTDSTEEAYNYCSNIGTHVFFTGPLGEIHFNEMLFINPSSQWNQHLVSDTGTWTTTLARGAAYTLSVKAKPGFLVTLFNLKAYIDFNHNGVFEPGEGFFTPQILSENRFADISIPIPEDAYIGKTRMRFVLPFTTTNEATISPCAIPEYLDFTVTIVQPDSCKSLSYALSSSPSCFNQGNGVLSIIPVGGEAPYSIQWNTGNSADTLATLSGLGANAMHRASITDTRGCNLRTAMAIVSQSSPVRIDTSLLNALKLVLNGGGSPYEIQISGGGLSMPLLFTGIEDTLALSSLNDGLYTLQVKDTNACTYNLGEIELMHAGILAGKAAKELVLYPNPAKGSTRVEGLKRFSANIYDSRGAFVRQLKDDNGELNLTTLNPGLYLLQIQKEDELYSQKLIVK